MRISHYIILVLLALSFKGFSQGGKFIRFNNLSINEGLSQSSVFSIVQDEKGFVWIATQDGLNKYDGHDFLTYYHSQFDTNTILSNTINCLYHDSTRDFLWIGTSSGLNILDLVKNKLSSINVGSTLKNEITGITGDAYGQIWVNVLDQGVYVAKDKQLKKIINEPVNHVFIFENKLIASLDDKGYEVDLVSKKLFKKPKYHHLVDIKKVDGKIVLLKENGLSILKGDQVIRLEEEYDLLKGARFTSLLNENNTIWIGTQNKGLFLLDVENNTIQNYQHDINQKYSLADNNVTTIFKDYAGIIWVGTENNGMSLFDYTKQNIKYIGVKTPNKSGLSSKIIWSISSDEFGNIFIGTDNGLDIYNQFSNRIRNTSLKGNNIRALYTENHILVGADDALYKTDFSAGKVTFNNFFRGLKDSNFIDITVYTITQQNENNFLLGTNKGLLQFNIQNKNYHFFNEKNTNITSNDVRVVFKDQDEEWWIGTSVGLNKLRFITDTSVAFSSYLPSNNPNSISGEIITTITQDDSGYLWIGTYDGALNKFDTKKNTFTNYSVKDGLSNNAIYGILIAEGHLWISTNRGISTLNLKTNKFKNYFESDGLQSNEFNTGAFHQTKYGELFFGGVNGVSHFFPSDLKSNTAIPKLALNKVLVNNKELNLIDKYKDQNPSYIDEIELNYSQNNLAIYFSSLHYSNSLKNKYRYFIRELQDTSLITSNTGVANYASLSPGSYTLVVYASNSDGVWTQKPLELKIKINPPFWGTWWFRVAVFGLIGLIIFSLIRFRLKSVKRQKELLEEIVKRRTETVFQQKEQIEKQKAEIEKEKEKADSVLYKIFPDKIAEKLKNRGKVKAEHYDQATIIFADFVRFSKISNSLTPEALVSELNKYFKEFDKIIVANKLTQIKTIGDSYMAVGGIPKKNKTNAIDTVLAGLQIQEYMNQLKEEEEEVWQVRVGINTGEIVAGVLETKRPLYDIWGSDVNIASRLQDEGKPGMVNISEKTYRLIKPYFDCTPRGGILTKNVGVINMFYVDAIREELSVSGDGVRPNRKFWKLVDLHNHSQIKYHQLESDFLAFLSQNLPKGLYYHSVDHTIDVVDACERIALAEGIYDVRLILLKTAALIHDAGFIKQYEKNEPIGVEYAKEFLPKYGFSEDQIKKVCELIIATDIAHRPKNKLQKIIKDADLDYLGREDFEKISDKLFQELHERGKIADKEEWDKLQVTFFETHQYYTNYSKNRRSKKKQLNKPDLIKSND